MSRYGAKKHLQKYLNEFNLKNNARGYENQAKVLNFYYQRNSKVDL
jgi:hypothetical protein